MKALFRKARCVAASAPSMRVFSRSNRSEQYDRVLSVAVLEHLGEMPAIIAASARLIRQGGVFQAGIPAEGGLLWGLAWRLTTAIAYRARTGLAYAPVMRHEHLNTAARSFR